MTTFQGAFYRFSPFFSLCSSRFLSIACCRPEGLLPFTFATLPCLICAFKAESTLAFPLFLSVRPPTSVLPLAPAQDFFLISSCLGLCNDVFGLGGSVSTSTGSHDLDAPCSSLFQSSSEGSFIEAKQPHLWPLCLSRRSSTPQLLTGSLYKVDLATTAMLYQELA